MRPVGPSAWWGIAVAAILAGPAAAAEPKPVVADKVADVFVPAVPAPSFDGYFGPRLTQHGAGMGPQPGRPGQAAHGRDQCIAGTAASGQPTVLLYEPATVTMPAAVGGKTYVGKPGQFLQIERTWAPTDAVEVAMDLPVRVLPGGDQQPLGKPYADKVAIMRGPQGLAQDETVTEARLPEGWIGTQVYELAVQKSGQAGPGKLVLVPYADAGQTGGAFTAVGDKMEIRGP
jgi:hypothetical protein